MTPGGGVPGGMVNLSAKSRPFVPGGGNAAIFKPQTPSTPYQPEAFVPYPSRSPLPGHRLGHEINPLSVQLTGLPAFLASRAIMNPMPYSPAYTGPPSPLSPNASGPASPFMIPQGQVNLGFPTPGGMLPSNTKFRKGKPLPPVIPLKTTGDNSTPSISMNPAAFAANLAALKAKKKVIVSVPHERSLPEDDLVFTNEEDEFKENGDGDQGSDAAKRRQARAAALTRQKWVQRQPWTSNQHDLIPCIEVPEDAVVTCEIHPEPWPHALGLPDTIEIYLPGTSAWDEYQDMRFEELQVEAEATAEPEIEAVDQDAFSRMMRPKALLPSQLAALNTDYKGRSLSISSPADPSMVSFKLNRFLQSQQQARSRPDQPLGVDDDNAKDGEDTVRPPFGRNQTDLPTRLREALARCRGETADLQLRPTLKHSHTMSLGLPSSGGPFGPEVFSALEMIRANSDEGPSKPPSESHDVPEKPLSDSEALPGRVEPFLARIAEDEGERDAKGEAAQGRHNTAGRTQSGNWQDLGRGFGYEVDPQAKAKRHARKTSRISVSTSHRDGNESNELLSDGEDVEIRTNPSEDADASDFEEELDEYGPEHWHARRTSAHLSAFGDTRGRSGFAANSDFSDDDSLRDSLTPSDEQFSNPSDEEAASEERMLRRQLRADERAARQERRSRQRSRANTNNTLPSSSIGEGDVHQHYHRGLDYLRHHERLRRGDQQDIVSNPSDEEQSDIDDSKTFGYSDRRGGADDGPRLSQDFKFPPPKPPTVSSQQPGQARVSSSNGPTMTGTLGRASGFSMLNPGAKEFKFGGSAGVSSTDRAVSAPVISSQDTQMPAQGHFRLPSIKTSSFGSALGDVTAAAPHLNVAAPAFTPGAFTFKAPDGARLQVPEATRSVSSSPKTASKGLENGDGDDYEKEREMQGREKRTRYGPIDYNSEDELAASYSNSPPRPKLSAASIEGPLRGFSSLARRGPPPFLPAGYDNQQQRAVSHESRFIDAPSFVPTWARSAQQHFGGSTSFRRPTLPDWGQRAKEGDEVKLTPSISDPNFFTMETGNKAIPIRRPSEVEQRGARSQAPSSQLDLSPGTEALSQDGLAVSPKGDKSASLNGGQMTSETLSAPTSWARPSESGSGWQVERARPIHIPVGPHSYQSSAASNTSDVGAGLSVRWRDHRRTSTFSRQSISLSSLDRRSRHSRRGAENGDGDDDDDEDESLTDFVEEIAERVDKALEGWAGKILDEVTIMGQVRPHPHVGLLSSDLSLDQDRIVQEISRRMEEALDSHLTTTFSKHARKLTGTSDETQSTIRPIRSRSSLTSEKASASGMVDAPGEWDFDYVQDILDVKLGEISKQIESTMAQVIETLDMRGDVPRIVVKDDDDGATINGSTVPFDILESVTSRLVNRLGSLFETHASTAKEEQAASQASLQQSLQDKLDENLLLLSEKGARDRSNMQQMLEAEMHGIERSVGELGTSVKGHLQTALAELLPPLLQKQTSSNATLADELTKQLSQTLAPVLSEERRRLLEDGHRNRDMMLDSLPPASAIAQATAKLVEPLVQSLRNDPIDSDTLVSRLAEVIGKHTEHMNLDPVIALLEPINAKYTEDKSFCKQILQRQQDTERTLSELPGAINAKTEIFLSSASEMSKTQGLVLEKIEELQRQTSSLNSQALLQKLQELTSDKETAAKTLSEIEAVYGVLNSSYEALSRLEAQHTTTESTHRDLLIKIEDQASASAKLALALREAEARATLAEASKAELAASLSSTEKEASVLRDQVAKLAAELAEVKAERIRERDASARLVSEANVRAERAEAATVEMQKETRKLLDQAASGEREAYESAKSVLERAYKAEGQVAALEKRISEQDRKICTLQELTATQKHKAAQSQQKLAESKRRIDELEAEAAKHEQIVKELEEVRGRLEECQESEMRLGEEAAELERELGRMKEREREVEEKDKLIEGLKARIAALEGGVEDAWESVEMPGIRPLWQSADELKMAGSRSFSFASTGSKREREVELDDGGWWS